MNSNKIFKKIILLSISLTLSLTVSAEVSLNAAEKKMLAESKIDTWIFDKGVGGSWGYVTRAQHREFTSRIKRDDATSKKLPLNDSCVREVSGSIYNSCSYPISVAYCFPKLPIASWADGQCEAGHIQTGFIQPGATILPHAWSDPVDIDWMACKLPNVPIDAKYDPSSQQPSGACGLLKNPSVLFSDEVLTRFSQ